MLIMLFFFKSQLLDDNYKAGNADTEMHAVLSFEVKSKRGLVKLRHQIKDDKAYCYPCCHKGLTAALKWRGETVFNEAKPEPFNDPAHSSQPTATHSLDFDRCRCFVI